MITPPALFKYYRRSSAGLQLLAIGFCFSSDGRVAAFFIHVDNS